MPERVHFLHSPLHLAMTMMPAAGSMASCSLALALVVAFLSNSAHSHLGICSVGWPVPSGGTIFAILGFVVGALVINRVGRTVLKADVSFDEMVRTLGLLELAAAALGGG